MAKENVVEHGILPVAEDVFTFDGSRPPADDGQLRAAPISRGLPAPSEQAKPDVVQPLKPTVFSTRGTTVSATAHLPSPSSVVSVKAAMASASMKTAQFSVPEKAALTMPIIANANRIVSNQASTIDAQNTPLLFQNAPASALAAKELKLASELAALIEHDLTQSPGCPSEGLRVTIYGVTPWQAMLTIGPRAGAVREPQKWRDLTRTIADRLRERYDLAWE